MPFGKKRIIAKDEYESLRNETIERITIMNNQSSNAFGVILTTWASGFVLLGIIVSNIDDLPNQALFLLLSGQIAAFLPLF